MPRMFDNVRLSVSMIEWVRRSSGNVVALAATVIPSSSWCPRARLPLRLKGTVRREPDQMHGGIQSLEAARRAKLAKGGCPHTSSFVSFAK